MQIQFSSSDHGPHIYFGSGDFFVTKQGFMHTSSGQIAGWTIDQNKIYKQIDPEKDETNKVTKQGIFASINSNTESHAVSAGTIGTLGSDKEPTGKHYNFYVNYDGYLFSNRGKIAGWNITKDSIQKTRSDGKNVGMRSDDSVDTNRAFFAGPTFYVTHGGFLYSEFGRLQNGIFKKIELIKFLKMKILPIGQYFSK